jgi:hypothetical protein
MSTGHVVLVETPCRTSHQYGFRARPPHTTSYHDRPIVQGAIENARCGLTGNIHLWIWSKIGCRPDHDLGAAQPPPGNINRDR